MAVSLVLTVLLSMVMSVKVGYMVVKNIFAYTLLAFDCYSGKISYLVIAAGKLVKERRLSAVWISRKSKNIFLSESYFSQYPHRPLSFLSETPRLNEVPDYIPL